MNELKVLENELVPVYETSTGEKVVYGTELHKALGVRSKYRDWIRNRINDCDAVEHEDYEPAKILAPSGQNKNEHIIKLDTAKEMAMLERNQKGKQVRRHFIQVEKKYSIAKEKISEQLEKITKIMEEQAAQIKEQSREIEMLKQHSTFMISENPFNPGDNKAEKLRELNRMTSRIARLRGTTKNRILHLMYRTMEERNGISLDSYREIYAKERGVPDTIGMLQVIAECEFLYNIAKDMCEEAIERYEIFGAVN